MGVSRSPLQLAEKMAVAAAEVGEIPAVATRAAGEAAAAIIRAGAPSNLRNVGKKGGARLGVRVTVMNGPAGARGLVRATGPWQIIEFDTKPHTIPKLARSSRSRKTGLSKQYGPAFGGVNEAKAVRLPSGKVRRMVFHPGTKGKHLFRKGAIAAKPVIPKVYEEASTVALAKVF